MREDQFYGRLGTTIKAARESRRMTQDQLAKALGLTRTSVTNMEAGRQKVLAHVAVQIAATLNVPIEELLSQQLIEGRLVAALSDDKARFLGKGIAKVNPNAD